MNEIEIGGHKVGPEHGAFIIAECGINHNDINLAKRLIDAAVMAGANAVKFQKRDPELAVPKEQWGEMKDTPWGRMNYITYKKRMEFWKKDYNEIEEHCHKRGIMWSASVWDMASAHFISKYDPPFLKVPSAKITDIDLLNYVTNHSNGPVIMSTGMSYPWEIDKAVEALGDPVIMHCTSTYPCPLKQINLLHIETLQEAFPDHIIGYSNHNPGIMACVAASVMGADVIEAHITLDRAMWGTDQAASYEPRGFARMVKYVRDMEKAMGNGIKQVYLEEKPIRAKLRGEDD